MLHGLAFPLLRPYPSPGPCSDRLARSCAAGVDANRSIEQGFDPLGIAPLTAGDNVEDHGGPSPLVSLPVSGSTFASLRSVLVVQDNAER